MYRLLTKMAVRSRTPVPHPSGGPFNNIDLCKIVRICGDLIWVNSSLGFRSGLA